LGFCDKFLGFHINLGISLGHLSAEGGLGFSFWVWGFGVLCFGFWGFDFDVLDF